MIKMFLKRPNNITCSLPEKTQRNTLNLASTNRSKLNRDCIQYQRRSFHFFEKLVNRSSVGYGLRRLASRGGEAHQQGSDEGIDGIIN
jgi:restriction endonuclease Mrr